jgi:hypothetical protein
MPTDPRQHPDPHVENDKQLGNPEPAKAHWPLDLELHPGRDDDDPHLQKRDNTTHPLNPPAERNSSIVAERDERPGS